MIRRPRGLWRDGDFLRFWSAQGISQAGTQVTQLALPLVAILLLHASTFRVSLLTTVEFLPWLLVSLPAGVWIDRLRRRPVLVAADLGRAAALAWVPVGGALGLLDVWQLYGVAFVAGCLTVFFDVGYQSYVPTLVSRARLVEGNAKLELTRSAAAVGGPGLGGVLVSALTAPYAIVADVGSYLASAFLLLSIRRREPAPEAAERSARADLLSGLRIVLGDPRTRALVLYVATSVFANGIFWAVFLLFAVRTLGLSAGLIGLVLALANVGSMVGALGAGFVGRRLGVGRALALAGVLSGAPLLLVAAAPASAALPFLVAGLLPTGIGIILYNVTAISLIQSITPRHLLGRANASRRFLVWGPMPLGSLVGGALGSSLGLRETVLVAAVTSTVAAGWLTRRPLRRLQALPEPEGDFAAAPSPATVA